MKYSDMIRRSFGTLKSGALWGFTATATVARMAVMLVALAAVYAVGAPSIESVMRGVLPPGAGNLSTGVAQVGYFGAIMLGLILAIPISLITLGGLTYLSDAVLAGRPTRMADGWRFGARYMGRVFAVQLVVSLLTFFVVAICSIPFVLAVVGIFAASGASGSRNPVALVLGVCCGYLLFLIFVVLAAIFFAALGAIAVRYAVIGQRTAGDALGSAWKAVRARWKNVFVFSLILFGLGMVWVAASSIVLLPVQFATGMGARPQTLNHLLGAYAINGPLTALLALPLVIFTYSMWTAFFRQMTGLDVVEAPQPMYVPQPIYPPQPTYPPPGYGYPPSPPTPDAPMHPPYAPIPMAPGAPGVPEVPQPSTPSGSDDADHAGPEVPQPPA